MEGSVVSLRRDEDEDLVDYGESDVETETDNNLNVSTAATIEDPDIFADIPTHTELSIQGDDTKTVIERSAEEEVTTARTPATITTKTPEAAAVIKSLSELLKESAFRAALGLVEAGSISDFGFWADGLDFAVFLKVIGAAQIKACKYGAKCRSKKCTFDHGSSNRTAFSAEEKPRKLCSMINTPIGCPKGNACWFSHEAFGVPCADGVLRGTCTKGVYCVYKHDDDHVVASVEVVEQPPEQVERNHEITIFEPPARIDKPAAEMRTSRGIKRRHESEDETVEKTRRMQRERQSYQERSDRHRGGRNSSFERWNGGQNRRGSGQRRCEDRTTSRGGRGGRIGRGGRSGTCGPFEWKQRQTEKWGVKTQPLGNRVTFD